MYFDTKPRAFFEALMIQREMKLTQVLEYFLKDNGQPDFAWACRCILEIHGGEALRVVDNDGNESSFVEECLAQPDTYTLMVKDIAALDSRVRSGYLVVADLRYPQDDAPPEYYCNLVFHETLRVVGEKAGAASLAERVRAFTHYFAYQLATKNLSSAESLFSSFISDEYSAFTLEEKLRELESRYGEISYFDRVTLFTVYHGKGRNKKLFREMNLPKGVDRDLRRGEAEFYLVGRHTPSGIMINAGRVVLGIIEEQGLLKIVDIAWYVE